MKALRLFFLAGMISSLAGCGTFTRGFTQDVAIATAPPGATVTLSDGQTCTAPCTISIDRVAGLKAKVSKPGCQDTLQDLPSTFPEGGTVLLSVIDYQTGSAAEHQPNPLTVTLICDAGGPVTLSPYDDQTLNLLSGGQDLGVSLAPFDETIYVRQHDRFLSRIPSRP